MTAEKNRPPRPPLPRRPENRRPEQPLPPLKKVNRKRAAEIEYASVLLSADQYACLLTAIEKSREDAAILLGWTLEQVDATLKAPECRLFLQRAQDSFAEQLARAKLRLFRKAEITPGAIQARLMELAQMDPSETHGKIDGQVKALRTLAEILGMIGKEDDPLKKLRDKSPQELLGFIQQTASRMLPGPSTDDPLQ